MTPRLCSLAPVAGIVALAFAAPAGAQSGAFSTRSLTEPAKQGLAVTGALSDLIATSTGRVIVPNSWRPRAAPAGGLRYVNTQNASCHFTVSYAVKSVLAPIQDAVGYVAAGLPSASSRHLLDSGVRGNRAFRVIRRPGIGGQVRVDALWAGVLTKRTDIAPAGQAAWSEIHVSAVSRKGDECHSGTTREALGPTIGDSLAVARTKLRFTRKHG